MHLESILEPLCLSSSSSLPRIPFTSLSLLSSVLSLSPRRSQELGDQAEVEFFIVCLL